MAPACMLSHSVMFDSSRLHELQPTRLLCPSNFPGKNIRVGCPLLLQGTFLTQGLSPPSESPALAALTSWAVREAHGRFSLHQRSQALQTSPHQCFQHIQPTHYIAGEEFNQRTSDFLALAWNLTMCFPLNTMNQERIQAAVYHHRKREEGAP